MLQQMPLPLTTTSFTLFQKKKKSPFNPWQQLGPLFLREQHNHHLALFMGKVWGWFWPTLPY